MPLDHDERRSHPRFEVNKPAIVVVDGAEIPCTLQNLSSLGAGLLFAPGITIPDQIALRLHSGETVSARVAWRAWPRCGVQFDRLIVFSPEPPEPEPQDPPPKGGLRGLVGRLGRPGRRDR